MDTEHSPRRPSNDENIPNNIMKDAAEADDNNLHRQERKHLLITETTGKKLSLKVQWYVYVSHFLSAWGDRMWQFGVGLFMVIISPDSLFLTAAYGFATGGAVLLFGTLVGDWIDKTPRLRAARVTLLAQNLSVMACSIVLYFVITYKKEIESYWANSGLLTLSYIIIITLAIVSQLASAGTTIAVERDWIVEICEKDTDLLAATSAKLKGIDLITNIVAPIATGQIMYFTSENIGALFIAGWNLISVVVEYYLLWKVHELVPRLREKKYKSNVEAGNHEGEAEQEQARCTSCLKSLVSGFVILIQGWKTYTKYEAAFAGLGLACLYMTVLGFDNITVGFAYTQGVNESFMGALMAAGALIGILGASIYPWIRKKVGIERTGLYGLFSQVAILSLCVVSVWAPGSPFDPYIRTRNAEIIPAQNISMAVTKSGTETSYYTTALYNNHYDGGNPSDSYRNMSSDDVTGTHVPNLLNGSEALETVTETIIQTEEKSWKNYISVGLLMCGIIGARFGLWIADLSINQIFLETVADTERGIVLGVQTSLNQLMDMLKFVMVMVAPETELFGILVLISFIFVCLGWAFYAKFSFSTRRHLFHLERVIVCRKDYEFL